MAQVSPPVLERFLDEVTRLTGLRICLYDQQYFLSDAPGLALSVRLRHHTSPMCDLMKTQSQMKHRCIEVENRKTAKVCRTGQPLTHTCYAGVTDLVTPITVEGRHVGAIMIGQTLPRDKRVLDKKLDQLRRRYHFSREQLDQAAAKMPRHRRGEVRHQQKLLMAIKDYIEQIEENVRLKRESQFFHDERQLPPRPEQAVREGAVPLVKLDHMIQGTSESGAESIQGALRIIRQQYHTDLSQKEVAYRLAISSSHFSRQFHKHTGMTFRRCLLETRLNAAFYLIKRYQITIDNAALLVGYGSPGVFQRAFKNVTGLTPRQFLRQHPRAFSATPVVSLNRKRE